MIGIASPLAGWVTPLDDVPDPVFAERMLGDGVAVDPVEGRVVAPGAGIVSSIHPAGHAVTLKLDSGPVLLIHVGLDTVALGGAGFTPRVKDGERVAEGDLLIEFDLDLLARRTRSLVTPVIVTNGDAFRVPSSTAEGAINLGQVLFKVEPTGSETGVPAAETTTASRRNPGRRCHTSYDCRGRSMHRQVAILVGPRRNAGTRPRRGRLSRAGREGLDY